jgi:hypothetical protein
MKEYALVRMNMQTSRWTRPGAYGKRVERAGARGPTRAVPGRRARGPYGAAPVTSLALLLAGSVILLAGCAVLLAGCSGGPGAGGAGGAGAGATCGTTRTAAGVPVVIKVAKGSVNCRTALEVENDYAAKIRAGQVRGTGGGAPVTVDGWTCQGYNTPEMLQTGNASQCHTGTAMILAVLPVPTPSAG